MHVLYTHNIIITGNIIYYIRNIKRLLFGNHTVRLLLTSNNRSLMVFVFLNYSEGMAKNKGYHVCKRFFLVVVVISLMFASILIGAHRRAKL